MADATNLGGFEGENSQQGQGLAYVLPQSRTTGYFMQLANERAQERRQAAQQQLQQQQKANEEYAQHLYAYTTPKVSEEFSKYLQPQFDDYFTKMTDYHAKTGQDPFINPEFIRQKSDLTGMANSTQGLHTQATALGTALADKSKNYTPESAKAVSDALNEYHTNPTAYLNKPFPTLEGRNLGLNDAIKLGHANSIVEPQGQFNVTRPNTHNHVVQGQEILSQPEFAPMLQKQYNINTEVGDAFGQPNGRGGTIYPTDAPTVNSIADHILQNAAQPHFAATLQTAGIDPADPHAKDKLAELVAKQNNGYGKALTDFASRLDANVEQKKVRDYNPDRIAISEANLANSTRRLADAEEKQQQKTATATYVQNLAEKNRTNILSQFGDTPKPISNPFPELENLYINNPNYKHSLKPSVNQDGTILVNVPAQYKYDAKVADPKVQNSGRVKVKDAYQVTLDPSQPEQFKTTFGLLFDQATGEKTGQASKINTPGGKGHVGGGQAPAQHTPQYTIKGKGYSSDAVSKAAAASGMSVDEYVKAVNNQ